MSSLQVRGCGLGPQSLLLFRLALADSAHLTDLDLSSNPEMFSLQHIHKQFHREDRREASSTESFGDSAVQLGSMIANSRIR